MAEGRIPPGFEDFDLSSVYARYASAGLQADTLNFVIDFDSSTAFAALNLDLESIEKALQTEVREHLQRGPDLGLYPFFLLRHVLTPWLQRAGTTKSRWMYVATSRSPIQASELNSLTVIYGGQNGRKMWSRWAEQITNGVYF